MPNTKKNTFLTIYLWLVSIISFIGLAIAVILFTYQIISSNIISDQEYTAQNHREIDRCEEPVYLWSDINNIKTPQEIEECITKTEINLTLQRSIDTKETLLLSGLRTIVLLIIFPLHFIYFKKSNKHN
jgi:hypothetical protein